MKWCVASLTAASGAIKAVLPLQYRYSAVVVGEIGIIGIYQEGITQLHEAKPKTWSAPGR